MTRRAAEDFKRELAAVQQLLTGERLSVDDPQVGRTCFLSHLGAARRLAPTAWIAHRDLLWALALANLSVAQRTSLARAVLVDHGREFGVGRLRLVAHASGLPFGGSLLDLRPRAGGPACLVAWGLASGVPGVPCEWLVLTARPQWVEGKVDPPLRPSALETLVALGGETIVLVDGAVAARSVAEACRGRVAFAAHPRFAPHLEGHDPESAVLLWPHDALSGAGLRRHAPTAVVLVDAPAPVAGAARAWAATRSPVPEVAAVSGPGICSGAELDAWWGACGGPRVLLRGDPDWAHGVERRLAAHGALVAVQGAATQLGLF
jgi:hypothetical protein